MIQRSLKLYALAFILAVAMIFSASCTVLMPDTFTPCSHDKVSAGDCKTPGACLACGEKVGELGSHKYKSSVVAPKCDVDGYTKHVCSICGDSYTDNATVSTGHSFGEWIFTKHPTDTEPGEMYRICSVCYAEEKESIAPHVHTLLDGAGQTLTCTTDGWNDYKYCTQCQYTTKNVVKATGHNWNYTSNGDSTHTRVCANDNSHTSIDPCSGGSSVGGSLPVCEFCGGEYEFAARAGNSSYGYYALGGYATYGEGMQLLYKDLTALAESFYFSNDDVIPEGSYYEIGEFDLTTYGLNIEAGCAVWKIFYVSNPLYYWLDATIVTSGNNLILTISEDYAKAADRRAADEAIKAMTDEFSLLVNDGMTDIEKAMLITEYIVSNMEYAYESDGVTPVDDMWAHCMAGFATKGLGVCEAYAKTFMYLCLLNNVECIMGSGYAGEPHAWNYVKLDGEWYGADITWTDKSGDIAVYDCLGLSGDTIFADHTPHSSEVLGSSFIYKAPELADKDIEFTSLSKNGEYVGMYKSVDDAFAAMTDPNGEYEIYVGYYSFTVNAPKHTIKSTVTPNVKKLTIVGMNSKVGAPYLDNNSILSMPASLTLGSDVVLKNLMVETEVGTKVINLNGHTLTVAGESVYLNVRIAGLSHGSTVVAESVEKAYLLAGAEIYRLVIENDGVVFGMDSYIRSCNVNKIYLQAGVDVDVDWFD